AKDRGVALGTVAAEIQAFIESADAYSEPTAEGAQADGRLKEERLALGKALAEASQMVGTLTNWIVASQSDSRELYKVGLNSRLASRRRSARRLAPAAAGVRRAGRARSRRRFGGGPGVLPREGRGRAVLRPRGAAASRRRPAHR